MALRSLGKTEHILRLRPSQGQRGRHSQGEDNGGAKDHAANENDATPPPHERRARHACDVLTSHAMILDGAVSCRQIDEVPMLK